jgi:hypothetical protein
MTTVAIIREIRKLPFTAKLLVLEKTLKAIRQEREQDLAKAADALYNDYRNDKELTIFTSLDADKFYDAR